MPDNISIFSYCGGMPPPLINTMRPCKFPTWLSILWKNMKHLRNPCTGVSKETLHLTVKLYEEGLTTIQIGEKLGKSQASILNYLKSQNVKRRPAGKRSYPLNEKFFDNINTVEKAYWLGFLLADGNTPKGSVRCLLKSTDGHHLELLRSALKSEAPIRY